MSDDIRENTAALHELKTCIAVQTVEMKHQTEAICELKDELEGNGLAGNIVGGVSKVFYKTTGLFGFIVVIISTILYFVLRM